MWHNTAWTKYYINLLTNCMWIVVGYSSTEQCMPWNIIEIIINIQKLRNIACDYYCGLNIFKENNPQISNDKPPIIMIRHLGEHHLSK